MVRGVENNTRESKQGGVGDGSPRAGRARERVSEREREREREKERELETDREIQTERQRITKRKSVCEKERASVCVCKRGTEKERKAQSNERSACVGWGWLGDGLLQLRTVTADVFRTVCTTSIGELLACAFFIAAQVPPSPPEERERERDGQREMQGSDGATRGR